MQTTKGNRLHIGFFGKRNSGKSTLVNKITGQNISIVSDELGTTTDVNQKAMELLPIGPVMFLDTAGIDDVGELGNLRVEKTKTALLRCDIAIFVCDGNNLAQIEKDFIKNLKIPVIAVVNKTDVNKISSNDFEFLKNNAKEVLQTSGVQKDNFIFEFKQALIKILPEDFINSGIILNDLVGTGETCVFVIPVDKEAPKGRIILPQMNALREMLDYNSISIVCTVESLKNALDNLCKPPKIVVTDSQAFKKVSEIVPLNIPLTSFSILFARMKGDLNSFVRGADKLDNLKENDKILILESCTHHPVEDDIGRVKLPNLIKNYTKLNLEFEHYSGHDFPQNIENYSLIIHCGGCMTTRREILNRIEISNRKNIPITNYGIAIAKCLNILRRATEMFKK